MTTQLKNPHAWFVVYDGKGNHQTLYQMETNEYAYPYAFEVNFSDQPTPAQNTVTIYNLSKEHRDFYKKGYKCRMDFNWGAAVKNICEGYLSEIGVNQSDGTTENIVITYTEGVDYKNLAARKLKVINSKKVNHYTKVKKKIPGKYVNKRVHYYTTEKGKKVGHYKYKKEYVKAHYETKRVKKKVTKTYTVNLTFKKGKTYEQIIKAVAAKAGIKLSKIQLHKNSAIKKAYTAKGKPLTVLKSLVKIAGSKLLYIRGDLQILDPKAKKRSWVVVNDDLLMAPPTLDQDDDGNDTWNITTPLLPDVSVLTGIIMQSKYLKGKFYVSSGQHMSDGTNPQSQLAIKTV